MCTKNSRMVICVALPRCLGKSCSRAVCDVVGVRLILGHAQLMLGVVYVACDAAKLYEKLSDMRNESGYKM